MEWNTHEHNKGERTEAKTKEMLQTSPCYIAAWSDGQLVGFGRILADPYVAQILDVMTHPDYWKRGIASGVTERLLDFARGRYLGVSLVAAGGLEGFYTRFGFEVANPESDVLMFLSERPKRETPIDESWYERPEEVSERLAAGGVVVRVEGERLKVALVREAGLDQYNLAERGRRAWRRPLRGGEA